MASRSILELSHVSKKFPRIVAVNDVSLDVPAGSVYALIGPNGSGKTTTVKMITGLYRPTSGTIVVDGVDAHLSPESAKARIGYIPDEPFMYERMTGREFLHMVGVLYGMHEQERKAAIDRLLPVFPLDQVIDEFVGQYSRGNKQKISILAALMHRPKLLVVDEPIVGLDPESALMVQQLLRDFTKKGGAVFLCTHTLSFAEKEAQRIGVLHNGRIIREGTMTTLRKATNLPEGTLEDIYIACVREARAES